MNLALSPSKEREIRSKKAKRKFRPPNKSDKLKGPTLRYSMLLLQDVRALKSIVKKYLTVHLPKLVDKIEKFDSSVKLDDDLTDAFTLIMGRIWRAYKAYLALKGPRGNATMAMKAADSVNQANKAAFIKEYRAALGVDPLQREPWLRQELDLFVTDNIDLIKDLQETYLSKIQKEVILGFRRGDSSKTIASKLKEIDGMTENRARLIARDQVSKLNTGLERLRAQKNGVTEYIWRTNIDGRERASHASVNGKTFTWASKGPAIGVKGEHVHPGEDIQCRCYAENIYKELQGL